MKKNNKPAPASLKQGGFSLIEILVSLVIFSVILSLVYIAYTTQLQTTTREYRISEAEMEIQIARNVIERDLNMAGYGLADDYSAATNPAFTAPRVANASNNDINSSDTLTMMGTALGINSQQTQAWTYAITNDPSFTTDWGDARENVGANDRVVLMEPATKKLLAQGGAWLFRYDGTNLTFANRLTTTPGGVSIYPAVGTLLYGLYGAANSGDDALLTLKPFYTVRYYLGGTPPANCATGTFSLLRAESRTDTSPGSGDAILDCVLDFEVAFGLDTISTDGSGPINLWDNGGQTKAKDYDPQTLKKRLKQIRVYILVQSGNLDTNYTSLASIPVGDSLLGTGRNVAITQQNYRWRLVTLSITPRNIR
ncbi:MAG: prepilin-type N-terminal cleavage/methylation domain-containing protein [Deltaproteobacteria bacterium]|nr:prepilin-type N-terminal cleavage/methylation domain-containing protein [Deltaproteobacteria bacterium]